MNKKPIIYHDYLYSTNYNTPYPSGVYGLVNVRSGKLYVGSSKNLTFRSAQHFKALEEGVHHNRNLQYSFDVTGPSGFSFVVLEYVADEDRLAEREQAWLNRLRRRTFNIQLRVRRPEDDEPGLPVDNVTLPWEEV